MNEEEFSATEQGRAVDSFIKYTMSLTMTFIASELGGRVTPLFGKFGRSVLNNSEIWLALGLPKESIERLREDENLIHMLDPEYDAAVRHSVVVIGACSAIEACIEDLSKAIIRADPSILDGTQYEAKQIKTPVADSEEMLDKQWSKIEKTDFGRGLT